MSHSFKRVGYWGANLRTLSRDLGNLRVPKACRGAHLKHFTGPRCRRLRLSSLDFVIFRAVWLEHMNLLFGAQIFITDPTYIKLVFSESL